MNFDELMKIIGEFGKFQKVRFLLICLCSIVFAWHALNSVFVGAAPDFHCKVPDINLTGTRYEGISPADRKKLYIPTDKAHQCYRYDVDLTSPIPANTSSPSYSLVTGNNTEHKYVWCTDGYDYSKDQYIATIVTDFNLVCDRKVWTSNSKSVFFCGKLFGALIFGQLSDRYGRRPMFFVGVIMLLVSGVIASFAPSIYVFLPVYFMQGAAKTGAYLVAFILSTELVGPSYRVIAGFVSHLCYSMGYISLAILGYLVRDWRWLEITITLPVLSFVILYWYLPESVRWLLSHGRDEEAEKILQHVAKTNKTELGHDVITALKNDPSMASTNTGKKYSALDCLKTWKMAKISLNVWFNWLVNALVYYGLSLNTEKLAGNPYMNFGMAGVVELPAYIICMVILNKVGRRWPLIISMYIGGIACILSGVLPEDMVTVKVVLAMVGKFGITASYGVIYLMTVELFPTVIRNSAMGVASMSSRIGGVIAPQLLALEHLYKPLPLLVFGGLTVLAASLAIFFPETTGKALPQTTDDVDFGNGSSENDYKKKQKYDAYELNDTKI